MKVSFAHVSWFVKGFIADFYKEKSFSDVFIDSLVKSVFENLKEDNEVLSVINSEAPFERDILREAFKAFQNPNANIQPRRVFCVYPFGLANSNSNIKAFLLEGDAEMYSENCPNPNASVEELKVFSSYKEAREEENGYRRKQILAKLTDEDLKILGITR